MWAFCRWIPVILRWHAFIKAGWIWKYCHAYKDFMTFCWPEMIICSQMHKHLNQTWCRTVRSLLQSFCGYFVASWNFKWQTCIILKQSESLSCNIQQGHISSSFSVRMQHKKSFGLFARVHWRWLGNIWDDINILCYKKQLMLQVKYVRSGSTPLKKWWQCLPTLQRNRQEMCAEHTVEIKP